MLKYKIEELLQESLKKAYPKAKSDSGILKVEHTAKKFGDYSSNIALILAKAINQEPQQIASKLIRNLPKTDYFEQVGTSGGFINFRLSRDWLIKQIDLIISQSDDFGKSKVGEDMQVLIEFISANPTGPLHIGNGRGGFWGDVLATCMEASGYRVTREYYVNDTGNQIEALGHSVLKDEKAVYKGKYIDEVAAKVKEKDPMQAGKSAAYIILHDYIKPTVKKMGIKFDHWFSEDSLHQESDITKSLAILKKTKDIYIKDGAAWYKTSKYGDEKDRVLQRKDGQFTYFAADIAYHWNKIKRGYNLLVDIWGADHHGYVNRVKIAVERGIKPTVNWGGRFDILISQLVRLVSEGESTKISKREGKIFTIDELIDEVGLDAARFFFLTKSLNTHMDFDLDLAKERSQKNPVYYIQYAHARMSSLLKIAKNSRFDSAKSDLLKDPIEIDLIRQIILFPEIVEDVTVSYNVQKLPFYALELANCFHKFYDTCQVISKDQKLTEARLALVHATKIALRNTLKMMGISAPKKM